MIVDFEKLNVVFVCRDFDYNIVIGYLLNDELNEYVCYGSKADFDRLAYEYREYLKTH